MGFGIGLINSDIGTSNSRNPYAEFMINGVTQFPGSQIFTQSIPDGDQGYLEAWTYSLDSSSGHYTAKTLAYSPASRNQYIAIQDMGLSYRSGPVSTSIEAAYISNYNNTCDNYGQYTTTSTAVYTTAVQSAEPLTIASSWLNCTPDPSTSDAPYNVALASACYQTVRYWGG
jgi:hypothetical protein